MSDWRDEHNGDVPTPDWRKGGEYLNTSLDTSLDRLHDAALALHIKKKILALLDAEIEYAKTCGMPQFTLGMIQARMIVDKYETWVPNKVEGENG